MTLVLVLIAVATSIAATAIFLLYRVTIEQKAGELQQLALSQARLIEAVARFDSVYSADYPSGPTIATLDQIREAHDQFRGFGDSGTFTLSRRSGDQIVFLLQHRNGGESAWEPVHFDAAAAEPSRRALEGESGTLIGLDHRGVEVLAAYEPVAILDLAIVAQIDMAELRQTFLHTALITAVIGAAIIAAGSLIFLRLTNPIIARMRDSEMRFRSTFEQAAVGMAHVATDGSWLRVNRRLCGILGYNHEELLSKSFQEITHPAHLDADRAAMLQLLHGEIASYITEKRYIRKNGDAIWANLTVSLIRKADGTPDYFSSVIEHIDERKKAEAALRESEENIRQKVDELDHLYNAAPVGLAHLDKNLRYVRINPRLADLNGRLPEEHIGRTLRDILPDMADQMEALLRPTLESGTPLLDQEFSGETAREPGVTRHWLSSWYPLFGEGTQVEGIIVAVVEITEQKRNAIELKESQEWIRLLLDSTGEGIYAVDRDGRCTLCNTAAARMLGYPSPDFLLGVPMHGLIHHSHEDGQSYPITQCPINLVFEDGQPRERRNEVFWRRDGSCFPVAYHSHPVYHQGELAGAVCSFSDTTDIRRAEEETALYATVFGSSREAVVISNAEKKVIAVNSAFSEISGWLDLDAFGQHISLLNSGQHEPAFYAGIRKALTEQRQWQGEIWLKRKNEEIFPAWLTISAVSDQFDRVTHYIDSFSDISILKCNEARLEHLAHHHALTGLPNRLLFSARLTHSLQAAARDDQQLALMFIDIDRFKQINDEYGHDAGDTLLIQFAERLSERLCKRDTAAHIADDEFCVVIEQLGRPEDAQQMAQSLLQTMRQPFQLSEQEMHISISIGIALYPQDGADEQTLLKHADDAMYRAKQACRDHWCLYAEAPAKRFKEPPRR